ncbi:aminodeoxychorismate synthase component I [Rubritalea tangerina]|uniref:Aminodeoxychorismate synthase component I n=1 Tax=Rubritalea tangerina TaxID=430798 RepID=A0ABW4ZAI1_9BACT
MAEPELRMMKVPLKAVELNLLPEEVAGGLEHLGGVVFFDSSGNLPDGSEGAISIVAARPEEVIRGEVSDVSRLEEVLAARASDVSELPNGGLCGWISYEGAFCFGVYPEMLVYVHDSEQWYEVGGLSSAIKMDWREEGGMEVSGFRQEMTERAYLEKVQAIKEYIAAGDIYQVNLAHKFSAEVQGGTAYGLYLELREQSPAPHASYLSLDGTEVLSSSPETFLKFEGKRVSTRPIKGTRPRFSDPAEDQRSAYELRTSEKEVSELVMITDLERNDLGQVCEFGSVRVDSMLKLESYEHVYHLVSTVSGELGSETGQVAAVQACFPGGSITGAPKKRAMEIIDELESCSRGVYTGAIGYFGFNGLSQFNIAIRTMVREGDELHYHVGAGIVADSDPQAEYHETLQKGMGMKLAVSAFKEKCSRGV